MIKYEKDNAERVSDSQRRRIVRMHPRTTAEENNSKSDRGGKSHSHDHRIIRKVREHKERKTFTRIWQEHDTLIIN